MNESASAINDGARQGEILIFDMSLGGDVGVLTASHPFMGRSASTTQTFSNHEANLLIMER
jgi:hypothetical protein